MNDCRGEVDIITIYIFSYLTAVDKEARPRDADVITIQSFITADPVDKGLQIQLRGGGEVNETLGCVEGQPSAVYVYHHQSERNSLSSSPSTSALFNPHLLPLKQPPRIIHHGLRCDQEDAVRKSRKVRSQS